MHWVNILESKGHGGLVEAILGLNHLARSGASRQYSPHIIDI